MITGGTARDFEQVLDAVTAELVAGPAIDYRHRREALATWTLEPLNWRHILTQLPDLTSHRSPISARRLQSTVEAHLDAITAALPRAGEHERALAIAAGETAALAG